jgi:hypothetical protein
MEDCAFRFPGICNFNPETTMFCHINTKYKGTAIKSPDLFGAYGCSDCHQALDLHLVKHPDWVIDAVFETQMKLFEKGLIKIV